MDLKSRKQIFTGRDHFALRGVYFALALGLIRNFGQMPSNLPIVDAGEVATLADAGYLERLDSRALLLVLAVSGVHHTVAGALLDNTQTENGRNFTKKV
jgi:hypothetical protein